MKYFFLLVIALYSCSSIKYRNECSCKKSNHELFNQIIEIGKNENLKLDSMDINTGFIVLNNIKDEPPQVKNDFKWSSYSQKNVPAISKYETRCNRVWEIFFNEGKLIAYAFIKMEWRCISWLGANGGSKKEYNFEIKYCNDSTARGENFYWHFREELEELCGNKIKVVKD
ncbi:MAG: hypothetical protein ABSG15_08540 [FCB group bacterium]|jgi:dimeric dUTPase (all-alpha-NTP-PPase superfamily)